MKNKFILLKYIFINMYVMLLNVASNTTYLRYKIIPDLHHRLQQILVQIFSVCSHDLGLKTDA